MADRICHLCYLLYNDEDKHSYESCEKRLLDRVDELEEELASAKTRREQASLARQKNSDRG